MTSLSGPIKANCAGIETPTPIKQPGTEPSPPGFLHRFAAHKVAPATLNYTAGALAFTGAALFFTGVCTLPGIILMAVGAGVFTFGSALMTCNLPEDIGTGDYVQFSGQCFVWGVCLAFTLPTIVLLLISFYFSTWWLLQDGHPSGTDCPFSSDLSWLMAPPIKDKLPDSQAFSGLEVA